MRFQITLLTVVVLLTAGCGGPSHYWFRHDATLEQARADCRDCREQARQEASEAVAADYLDRVNSPLHPPTAYSTPHDDSGLSDSPLEAWSTWGRTYEQNVFAGCMKRKGYEHLKSDRLPARTRTKNLDLGAIAGR